MSRKAAAATLLLITAAGAPAAAYELQLAPSGEPVRWATGEVATSIELEDGPAGMAAGAAAAAAGRALATWSEAGAPVFPAAAGDRPRLRIRFAMQEEDPAIDPAALALTHLSFDSLTGELASVEVAVNAFAFRWAAGDDCSRGADDYQYDLESTLAHEIGHAIGLRHSEAPDATMATRPQPCASERRDLAPDDLAAVAALYGDGAGPGEDPAPAACSAAGGGGPGALPSALLVIAAGVAAGAARRRPPAAAASRCAG